MTDNITNRKDKQKSSANKRYRSAHRSVRRLLIGFACLFGILCISLICLKLLINGENKKAVEEFNESNYFEIMKLDDKSFRIKGCDNGVPFDYVDDGSLCEGIQIGNIDVGGMSYDEARTALLGSMDTILSEINMTVKLKDSSITLTAGDFNVASNINDVLHEALKIGRRYNPADAASKQTYESVESYQNKIHAFWQNYDERQKTAEGVNFDLEFYMDDAAASELADEIAAHVNIEPKEPYVTLTDRLTGANSTDPGLSSDIYDKITVYTPFDMPVADIVFHKGSNGYILDRDDLAAKFTEAFRTENYEADIEAVYIEHGEPKVKVEELFASTRKITSASTEYKSSGANRSFNVYFGASKLNCMVMMPDVEISFNDYLGPRREIDGWKLAHQIVNGNEYVDTPGGGLCQVSSTFYNALLQTGPDHMQITERSHHSIPSDYVDLGLDATVSYPQPDLKWKCVGDSPLYLFAYTDNKNKVIYMDVYGSIPDDGCTYKIYNNLVSTTHPKDPLQIPEPLWPEGFHKMMIKPRTGYTVEVYRQKYDRDGNKVGEPELLYTDRYASVRGEYHYGTGDPSLPKPNL